MLIADDFENRENDKEAIFLLHKMIVVTDLRQLSGCKKPNKEKLWHTTVTEMSV